MNIGIIGAGNIGAALAMHFGKLNHTVKIANSRGPSTLGEVARKTGAHPVDILEAGKDIDLVVITIPMKAIGALPQKLWEQLPQQIPIIDTCNYYPLRDGKIKEIEDGMIESEWVSGQVGRPVIKVFNSIMTESLIRKGLPRSAKNRVALPVAGDDRVAKQTVLELVDAMGFDAVDAGTLSQSWRQQPGTPAYCSDPNKAELQALLGRADRNKAPVNRDLGARILAKIPVDFPREDLVRFSRLFAGMDIFKLQNYLAAFHVGLAISLTNLKRLLVTEPHSTN
ncbi:MAG: NAD(P)-binding domain-containing protein [Candidatus Obscuribacterales bacterium]|nr:NAD(P)-binding domain-containing protein [Candidatus Obscuribacterales bacterium]